MAITTIQVSEELVTQLKDRKMYNKESYEEIIWDLLEDSMELSEETKKNLIQAEKDIKERKVYTLEQIKKEFKIH